MKFWLGVGGFVKSFGWKWRFRLGVDGSVKCWLEIKILDMCDGMCKIFWMGLGVLNFGLVWVDVKIFVWEWMDLCIPLARNGDFGWVWMCKM